jgi:UDP-N-acetylmuramate: L-alanyl-gamma-D-glutamyl-meso-diaminopimelate ligase
LLSPEQRLDPERLIRDLQTSGKAAAYLPDADAIVRRLAMQAQGGDVVCVFSNGGFGGIHEKLLAAMGRE